MEVVVRYFKKYKGYILYLLFGVCVTFINSIVYHICYSSWGISNIKAVCFSWLTSVVFAFITNKLWVFESEKYRNRIIIRECISFFSCRIITGILELLVMYIAVDILMLEAFIWKIISNGFVVVLNYIAGRFVVFKKNCISN